MIRTTSIWLATVVLLSGSLQRAVADDGKQQVSKVVELIRKLDAPKRTDRDQAQEELLKLGPTILPKLPEVTSPELSAEQRRRMRQILPELWKQRLMEAVAGSDIKLSETSLKLSQVLAELKQQSGNDFQDMRPDFNQPTENPTVTLETATGKFWPLLDQVLQQASLSYYHFTNERIVGLQVQQAPGGPVTYDGAFRFELQRLMLDHQFNMDQQPSLGITLGVAVEPKLKPIMLELDLAKCSAVDDEGNELQFLGSQRIPLAMEKTAYHLPISLKADAPPRSAQKIAKLQGELLVWLPAHTQEFVFTNLQEGKPVAQSTSSVRISLQGIRDDEGLWTVPVIIEHLLDVGQVDSYLQAALENEIFLREADGTRFIQNGGLSTFGEEPGKLGIEYLFVDAPKPMKDYELVLRIPAGLTAVPVRFEFTDLPLP